MTNTSDGSHRRKPKPEGSFGGLKGDDGEAGPKDAALKALEDQLSEAKDARLEERFIWIVVTVILVDVLWFRNASNAVVPIVVLILELVILFILANRLGIQEVKGLLDRIMQGLSRGSSGG